MINIKDLPVYRNKDLILEELKKHQVIIVESPTGSGKTTQIPLILKEAGFAQDKVIGVTQPRRIATLSVCEFINNQLTDEQKGNGYCAYKMRFWDTTTDKTRIKILTDGMLLQELKTDPDLNSYSVIMIDEAHERSLNIDLILGLLKRILTKRPDFKVIISSATINTGTFSKFFTFNGKQAPIVSVKAKSFNVDVKYYPVRNSENFEETQHAICQIVNAKIKEFKSRNLQNNEDILVFLPGELEIKETQKAIYEFCDYKVLNIIPLYGRLSKEDQEKVFIPTPKGKTKVVLATNIAETSLTIDGIKVVIDSGLCKMNFYNQFNYTSSLLTRKISKSSAQQRAGRAGRTSDGTCFRLYEEKEYNSKPMYTQEEILRTDLSEVVLRMVDLGIRDIEHFDFITKPDFKSIKSAIITLQKLNAIDSERNLTSIGQQMVQFPLSPRLSRCLVQAMLTNPDLIRPVCICISFLSSRTPFLLPSGEEDTAREAHSRFSSPYGDFIAYQNIFKKYTNLANAEAKEKFCKTNYLDFQSMEEIVHIVGQLCDITKSLGFASVGENINNYEFIAKDCLKCLIPGLIQFVCINKKGSVYRTSTADEIYIHPGSAYFRRPPKFLLAGEIVMTSKTYARTVSPLDEQWIKELDFNLYNSLCRKERNTDRQSSVKDRILLSTKLINIYGMDFAVETQDKKKSLPVAIIPYEKLFQLSRAYRKASRHPKKINAALLYKGFYIQYGDSLREIIESGLRLNRLAFEPNLRVPYETFYQDNIEEIKPYLHSLMGLVHLTKYKNRLGYLELITSKNGVFFHVNKSFNEAINNNAYSLLTITDYCNGKEFKNTYNRIVGLLD